MKKTREERVADLLARDRELMARLRTATKADEADLLTQRKRIKSQMNLYGQEATKRRREQGLRVWEWWSYENELRWEKTRAEILANMDPEMRKALGYE